MMVSVCFRMLTNVATWNMRMQPLEPILMLTQGTHTYDAEEEEEQEILVPTKEGGTNLSNWTT